MHVRLLLAAALAVALALSSAAFATSAEEFDEDDPKLVAVEEQVEQIEPLAMELWPSEFGGLWRLENVESETIRVAFTEAAEERVAKLNESLPLEGIELEPVTVERSLAGLRDQQSQMIEDRDRVASGELSLAGVPSKYDLDIDVPGNQVVAIVDEGIETGPAEQTLTDRYGAVDVEATGTAVPEACSSRTNCAPNLRSGLKATGEGFFCSTAFTVKRPSGARQILSAAHCAGGINSDRKHAGSKYGAVKAQKQSGRVDAERHFVKSAWTARKWIYVNNGLKNQDVKSKSSWSGLALGSDICMSGVTSNKQCGLVRSKDYSPSYVPNGNRFIRTTYCGQGGDSGAGVYRRFGKDKVHGIHSGGSSGPCSQAGDFSLFGHIEYALSNLDVTLATVP